MTDKQTIEELAHRVIGATISSTRQTTGDSAIADSDFAERSLIQLIRRILEESCPHCRPERICPKCGIRTGWRSTTGEF